MADKTIILSIIVLAYNHQDFISQNLKGIFMQDFDGGTELIICNDASTDDTDNIIREKIKNAPSNFTVKYFNHSKNLGATPNYYFALKQASGKYLAFCEGDDYWTDPKKLSQQFNFMENNPDCSLCFHQVMNISPHAAYDGTVFAPVENRDYSAAEIYERWIIHTASVVMRREVLNSPAFKETLKSPALLYFDTITFLAAATVGKLHGLPQSMSAYRRHEQGISFKQNLTKDLAHNRLDTVIAQYYSGKIRNLSHWKIFIRSKQGFAATLKERKLTVAARFAGWLLRQWKISCIYLLKKWQK